MKTYAETSGFKPFNWAKFLKRKANKITPKMWENAYEAARKWPTCACGNLCDAIPRVPGSTSGLFGGGPKDGRLFDLGIQFFQAIESRSVTQARTVFTRIETRSAEILKEMGILE